MDDFIKNVLTTINTSVPNSIWTGDEIDDVSNDLVTRPLDNLGRIFQNALLNPVNRTLRPKITKYYTLINQKTKESLISSIKFPTIPDANEIYRGFDNQYMCDETYMNPTIDIIYFEGYRNTKNNKTGLPALYHETVSIITPTVSGTNLQYQRNESANFIEGVSNYLDEGTGFATEVPFINYTVIGAGGIYEGYKNIKIIFNNTNKTRIAEITA